MARLRSRSAERRSHNGRRRHNGMEDSDVPRSTHPQLKAPAVVGQLWVRTIYSSSYTYTRIAIPYMCTRARYCAVGNLYFTSQELAAVDDNCPVKLMPGTLAAAAALREPMHACSLLLQVFLMS